MKTRRHTHTLTLVNQVLTFGFGLMAKQWNSLDDFDVVFQHVDCSKIRVKSAEHEEHYRRVTDGKTYIQHPATQSIASVMSVHQFDLI